jgi:L-lysine 6-transaminase
MRAYDLPDTDTRDRFLSYLHGERMLVLSCGPKTIRYRPALNISSEAISEGLEITRKCLKKL